MTRSRVLAILFAAAVAAGVLALPASAAPPARAAGDHTITTTHFVIHYYTGVPGGTPDPNYSTETQAGDVAGAAETAYAMETGWGYPAPVDDGTDGRIDIYLVDNTATPMSGALGLAIPDNAGPAPSSGYIDLATPDQLTAAASLEGLTPEQEVQKTIAHELFHLFQYATWVPVNQSDTWLFEGSAQWAGFKAIGFPSDSAVSVVGPADIALTCRDNLAAHQMCDKDPYVEGGYSRWAFFQMLAEKYGVTFVHNVLVNGAAGQTAAVALTNAIAAKGDSLAGDFNEYAERLLNANFGVPALAAVRPDVFGSTMTGTASATIPAVTVPVNHLSARYVTFERGDENPNHTCYAASLAITVAIPSGTSSQPYYYWDYPGSSPQPLSVNGSTASITVPWDTCDWGTARGWVSIPNASTTVDGANFTVSATMTVDTNTLASSASPPGQATIWGTTVPVPTDDVAPTIDVFGPELLRISATSRVIRLIVDSSGVGTVNAALGSTTLGTGTLRAGNNDVRFKVPASLVASLRRAAATNLLTLTPMSPNGATAGTPVTRHVAIATPVKAKPKPKPKHRAKKK